ncbi:CCHC-type domain-containing protein [Aphelenchoides fujianensis]|nr:CCHC-type domain-containing protein [Aphelenchoides fujianensis]
MRTREELRALIVEKSPQIEASAVEWLGTLDAALFAEAASFRVEITKVDERLLFVYNLSVLFDGGCVVRIQTRWADETRPVWYTGVVLLVEITLEKLEAAFRECVRLLPDQVLPPVERPPLSDLSREYLRRNYISENTNLSRRFEHYALYCELCEVHVKGIFAVLEHKRCTEHELHHQRLHQRGRMIEEWIKRKPKIWLNYQAYVDKIRKRVADELRRFYTIPEVAALPQTMQTWGEMNEKYSVDFIPIGGFINGLIARDPADVRTQTVADFYVRIDARDGSELTSAQRADVFNELMPNKEPVEREEHLNGNVFKVEVSPNESIVLFITIDPKAARLALTTQLFSLYTRCCPKYLELAQIFRYWAHRMGLAKSFDEDGVSGAIFDYLLLYFMIQTDLVPVLNEDAFGCPMEEFLSRRDEEQLEHVRPLFAAIYAAEPMPGIERLFQCLMFFYGCAFNRQEIVQITSRAAVFKDTRGRRHFRIIEPLLGVNIFQVRAEQAHHLENCFFLAVADFLMMRNTDDGLERLRFTTYLTQQQTRLPRHQWGMGLAFVHYDSRQFRRPRPGEETHLIKVAFAHGINAFNTHLIKRTPLRCSYCRMATHAWRKCPELRLEMPKGPIVRGLAENLEDLCLQWFRLQGLKAEEVAAAQRFIDDFARRFNAEKPHPIAFLAFGSLMSGFGARGCDIDLCIDFGEEPMVEMREMKDEDLVEATTQALARQTDILEQIYEFCVCDEGFVDVRSVSKARVPIINFRYQSGDVDFHGDISCSNHLALHNTRLLNAYSRMDERVAPFVLAVKKWVKVAELNDASAGSFSSYAITICALHFLQQTTPPVLPSLQDETHFELPPPTEVDGWDVRFAQPNAPRLQPPVGKNEASIGELFIAFFDYFERFNWTNEVVQIRHPGRRLMKVDKDWARSAVAVEDPFELSHNLTSGVRSLKHLYFLKALNKMRHEFRDPQSKANTPEFDFESFADLLPKKPEVVDRKPPAAAPAIKTPAPANKTAA